MSSLREFFSWRYIAIALIDGGKGSECYRLFSTVDNLYLPHNKPSCDLVHATADCAYSAWAICKWGFQGNIFPESEYGV